MITDLLTPSQVQINLAARIKQRRLEQRLTQEQLAQKAGLPLATYRLFEQRGQISLSAFMLVAFALNALHELNELFTHPTWATMDEMLNAVTPKKRVRHV